MSCMHARQIWALNIDMVIRSTIIACYTPSSLYISFLLFSFILHYLFLFHIITILNFFLHYNYLFFLLHKGIKWFICSFIYIRKLSITLNTIYFFRVFFFWELKIFREKAIRMEYMQARKFYGCFFGLRGNIHFRIAILTNN